MAELDLIGLRQFREKLEAIDEPVQVIRSRGTVRVLGVWIPHTFQYDQKEVGDSEEITFRILRRKVSSKR